MIEFTLKRVLEILRIFDENPREPVVHHYRPGCEPLELRREQVKALVDMFGGDHNARVGVERLGQGAHSGPGLYGYYFSCPEQVSLLLDPPRDGQ